MDPVSEMAARELFEQKGLDVVGWYHSHPTFEPQPSIRDIENQTSYQVKKTMILAIKEILNKVPAFRIYFEMKLLVMNHLLGSSFLLTIKSMQPIDHKYNVFISVKDGAQPINTVGLYECLFKSIVLISFRSSLCLHTTSRTKTTSISRCLEYIS